MARRSWDETLARPALGGVRNGRSFKEASCLERAHLNRVAQPHRRRADFRLISADFRILRWPLDNVPRLFPPTWPPLTAAFALN